MKDGCRSQTGATYCEGCGKVIKTTATYIDGRRYCSQCAQRYQQHLYGQWHREER